MNHKVKTALTPLFAAVLGLSFLTGCNQFFDAAASVQASSVPGDPPSVSLDSASDNKGNFFVDAFRNIEIQVMSPNIRLENGEDYAVRYSLHGREQVEQLEVLDGTLHFKTGFDPLWNPGTGSWELVLTVPADAVLEDLRISTAAGTIHLSDRTFQNGLLDSTAGRMELNGLTCTSLELSSVSGSVRLEDSTADRLSAENLSGSLLLDGSFGQVSAKTVSGSCHCPARPPTVPFWKRSPARSMRLFPQILSLPRATAASLWTA